MAALAVTVGEELTDVPEERLTVVLPEADVLEAAEGTTADLTAVALRAETEAVSISLDILELV